MVTLYPRRHIQCTEIRLYFQTPSNLIHRGGSGQPKKWRTPSWHSVVVAEVRISPWILPLVCLNLTLCQVCIGLHLARIEMRGATALFFRTFPHAKMSSREGFCDEDMEPAMYFLQTPKKKRCLVEVWWEMLFNLWIRRYLNRVYLNRALLILFVRLIHTYRCSLFLTLAVEIKSQ